MFFTLEPEVAGNLGPGTVMDTTTHPPTVERLNYEFEGWLGDELVESFPCYLVSDHLRRLIEAARPTGCAFADAEITTSDEFAERHPDIVLPRFTWLRVTGRAGRDDFGLSAGHRLVVSARLLEAMRQSALEHCDVEPFRQ